jgi:hypothetical protein
MVEAIQDKRLFPSLSIYMSHSSSYILTRIFMIGQYNTILNLLNEFCSSVCFSNCESCTKLTNFSLNSQVLPMIILFLYLRTLYAHEYSG